MRKRWLPLILLGLGLLVPAWSPLRGEMSEEEKKRLFLQAREDIRPVPKASPTVTPRPKPKPAQSPTATPRPRPTATPTPRPKPTPDETPAPTPQPTSTPRATATPRATTPPRPPESTPPPRPKPSSDEDIIDIPDDRPTPKPEAPAQRAETPAPKPTPEPRKPAAGEKPVNAPIVVEKSGLQEDRGYEPPPRQQFSGLFKRWRYLTPATRKAIDQAKVKRGRWKYVIIHNSGTRQGNARVFDLYHRRVRKMQNGLAYHFVIGNGRSSGDGEIEIGNRWTRQINGGHVASDYLNDISIGICLVGDLNRDKPTPAQLAALEELVNYLRGRVGRVKGKPAIVKGHKEINPKPTDCPGDRFPLPWLRQKFKN